MPLEIKDTPDPEALVAELLLARMPDVIIATEVIPDPSRAPETVFIEHIGGGDLVGASEAGLGQPEIQVSVWAFGRGNSRALAMRVRRELLLAARQQAATSAGRLNDVEVSAGPFVVPSPNRPGNLYQHQTTYTLETAPVEP